MKKRKQLSLQISQIFILFALIFLATEALLHNLFNSSLCSSEGCLWAEELLRLAKNPLLSLGFLYFLLIFLLTTLFHRTGGGFFKALLPFMLSLGFLAESFLVLKMWLYYELLCWFCFIIFAFLCLTTTSLLFYLKSETFSSLHLFLALSGGLLGLVLATYFTTAKPILSSPVNTQEPKFILLHSSRCPACQSLLMEIKQWDLKLKLTPLNQGYPLLRALNLKKLPILIEIKEESVEIVSDPQRIKKKLSLKKPNVSCEGGQNKDEALCVLP